MKANSRLILRVYELFLNVGGMLATNAHISLTPRQVGMHTACCSEPIANMMRPSSATGTR